MTDWKTRLRDSDPARHVEMSAADIQRVRRVVLSAARDADRTAGFVWPRTFIVATAALTIICAVALVALQQNVVEMRRNAAVVVDAPSDNGEGRLVQKQQLQFATPGGTRIIWVFDSEFEIRGTLP